MKKKIIITVISFLIISCTSTENKKNSPKTIIEPQGEVFDFEQLNIDTIPLQISYPKLCKKIRAEKNSRDSLSYFLEEALVNKIFPYWYGTPWDFNGHTNVPNEEKIACGYFVSTTLKHLGFNLNRYKLAQQLPIHEAKTLSVGEPILDIQSDTFEVCLEEIKTSLTKGIYFVGLNDSHVGFLLKRKNQLFFIHSNYGIPTEVVIESAKKSTIFNSFRHFYIAKISTNQTLLNFWKTERKIPIITE